jgi:alpha-amylase
MKKFFPVLILFACLFNAAICQTRRPHHTSSQTIDGHPAWIMQGNIYEVNVRQYTPEGTFNAFAKHLDRLKAMGVQTLWFMPINPISDADRKGTLGSYYAVQDYTAINAEYGNLYDFKQLVAAAHDHGMKVIIDWVPNHTGADNKWLTTHPDFFVKGADGKPAPPYNWMDVRQLDYKNVEMQDSMINAMKFWLVNTHIDGFRCDVAWNVPGSFWQRCISTLGKGRSLLMLAEGDKTYLHPSGFDATYSWEMFHAMVNVAKGKSPATALDSVKLKYESEYPKNALEMYFTSNHDENSDNGADYRIFPGLVHAPFAVLTFTLPHSVPEIYSGQEEPVLRAIKFFDKDTIVFKNYARATFYKTLLNLRKNNAALSADASFRKVHMGDDNAVYAFVREKGGEKVLVVLNLSASEQNVQLSDPSLERSAYSVFAHERQKLTGKPWTISPWGYAVYTY